MRLIDADALKRKSRLAGLNVYAAPYHAVTVDEIESATTIEAEPVRHGRWVKRGNKWQCTYCKVLMNIDGTPEENLLNYCPNCGTKND